jgi:hypothetical protein
MAFIGMKVYDQKNSKADYPDAQERRLAALG